MANFNCLRPTRTILLCVVLGLCRLAYAADVADTRTYDIQAQPLSEALKRFSQQSGTQLFYDAKLVSGLQSLGIRGTYSREQALGRLLTGTGLNHKIKQGNIVILEAGGRVAPQPAGSPGPGSSVTLPKVQVNASAFTENDDPRNPRYNRPNAITATKTDTPIMDTPLNVQVVTQQVLKDQQVYQLDKALQNISGTFADTVGAGGGNSMATNIRGFNSNDTYRNGLRFQSGQSTGTDDLANIERVEVLKGPASMLYGRIEPGGIVNIVTKTPLNQRYYALEQKFGSFDLYRTTGDATGPLSDDGSLLYRLNFAYESANSFQDFRSNEKGFVAPVVQWNIGPSTQATFEFQYKNAQDPVDYGIEALGRRPASVPRSFNANEAFNSNTSQNYLAGYNVTHSFNEDWKLRHSFHWVGTHTTIQSVAALGPVYPATLVIPRYIAASALDSDTYFTTLNLTGKFDTYGLGHTVLWGFDYYNFDQTNPVRAAEFSGINVISPVHGVGTEGAVIQNAHYSNKEDWYGLYMQDQVKLPYEFQLLAGFRYDNATSKFAADDQISSDFSFQMGSESGKVTPRVGLLWRPIPELSVYGNYVENFGAPNMAVANTGGAPGPSAPQTAQQWEVGMKGELQGGRLTGTLSWFNLTKQNLPAADHNNPLKTILIGEARNQGLEIDLSGEILPGWRFIAVGAYIDAEITKDPQVDFVTGELTSGTSGNRLYNVPEFSGTVWTTYEWDAGLFRGFKIGGGMVARSQTEGDNDNTYQLPGYVIANIMAAYPIKVGRSTLTLQLNVDNLLDKDYFYSSTGFAGAHFGAPRTFLGSLRLEF